MSLEPWHLIVVFAIFAVQQVLVQLIQWRRTEQDNSSRLKEHIAQHPDPTAAATALSVWEAQEQAFKRVQKQKEQPAEEDNTIEIEGVKFHRVRGFGDLR